MYKHLSALLLALLMLTSCREAKVQLTHGIDESAGGGSVYIITSPSATYYLEKTGGGLSSMIDKDGVDWIGFHNKKGSAHKGEYRGFPNAVHKQDGSYFHAMNVGTDPSGSAVDIESENHVRITFTSDNELWQGQWDFYPNRCDFTMTKISSGYNYWVQYEGVPGGEMNRTDFWYASADTKQHPIDEPFEDDLPSPEWMAFGDTNSPRVLYLLHHEDDELPDNYVYRPDMTVLGFGRQNGDKTTKHLTTVQTFSIGFVESTERSAIDFAIRKLLE
ncbi:hypothetical protein [Maribacter halichondriae]|uniref:hypothetical protein n=1 Tax=Maribacter halichondriae TaxID=2980554 RepID=UPI002359C960|nr:hypothetical protein [Maribacter sp. Hal144]